MYYAYVLRSSSSGQFYIGQTRDLDKRVKRHNNNRVRSTKNKGPWQLIGYIEVTNRSEAMEMERKLKGMKKRSQVKKWLERHGVMKVQNPTI
jgi:putative endonuclease